MMWASSLAWVIDMPGFNWTTGRLSRLRSAVRSFNAALTRRARELESQGLGHLARFLPDRVTVEGIKSRVTDANAFRRIVGYRNDAKRGRTSELTRILRSVDPHALDVVGSEDAGYTTAYARRQRELDERAIRRAARRTVTDVSAELFPGDTAYDLEAMTAPELGAMASDTEIPIPGGEPDDSVVDVDASTLNRWREEDAREKRAAVEPVAMYDTYKAVWTDPANMHDSMPGYQDMIDALEWLATKRTDVLNKMFTIGRDEMDPRFITTSGGANNPYVNTPYETRHMRAVDYVTSMAERAGYEG